jgi:polysaccharide biosynthesis transport protein
MSRNYELMLKAGGAREPHREPLVAMRPSPLSAPLVERATAPEQPDNLNILGVWQAILRRRVWIYVCTVTMLAAAALVCLLMTPQYKAESKLELLKQDSSSLSLSPGGTSSDASSDALDFNVILQTQLGVLRSDVLAWQVMRELKLVNAKDARANPPYTAGTPQLNETTDPAPDKESARSLKKFKAHLKVNAISGTRLIAVSYMHPDPHLAAKIVNQLVSDFVEYNFQVRYNATTKATDWLGSQLVELKSQLEQSQQRSVQLQKESGIFGQDEHNNIVLTRLEQLNNQVTSAEADRVVKESVYRLSRSGNPELIAGMLGAQPERNMTEAANPASLLNNLRQQEATLKSEYADASAKYGPAYPRLIQIKEKLNSVRSSLAAELGKVTGRAKSEYELAASREASARKAFAEQKAIAAQMNDKATDFLIAKREAESNRVLYEHLLEKLKEAAVLAGLHSNALHVVDPARAPTLASRPNVPLYLGFGVLSGLFLGLVIVFIAEAMDRTVRDVQGIEIDTRVPVLGVVPDASLVPDNRFRLLSKDRMREAENGTMPDALFRGLGNPAVAEAFRAVRTSLLLSRLGGSSKVLMVTSGMPQEGKSFVSLNLAAAFTYSGAKVLLVDADLQRGNLSSALNQHSGMGLSEVVRGVPNFGAHLPANELQLKDLDSSAAYRQIDYIPGLTFMPAGEFYRDASELLGSHQMSALIESWRDQYDYVLVDTPPILPLTDAVVLSRKIDAVIIVIRFAVTSQPSIQRTIRLLKDVQAPRLGMLINAMDLHSPEYFQYSGFYGGYDYGNRHVELSCGRGSSPSKT